MSNVLIQVVDENDRPVRGAPKEEVWQGLRHRVVWVWLDDGKGNVLLQHRDPSKKMLPNMWECAAGGHVDEGEDYLTAALRETEEEIGLKGIELQELGSGYFEEMVQGYDLKRFFRAYKGTVTETPAKLEAGGVDAVKWFTLAEAKKLVEDNPGNVGHGLREVINRYYTELK